MVFYFALCGLLFILMIFVILFFLPIKLTRGQLLTLWGIYIVLLAIFGYYIEPGYELDLYRIYQEINQYRAGVASIFDSPLVVMNIIYWLISRTNDNGWLVVVTVAIWGICIGKVESEYLRNHNYTTKSVILYYLAANGGCFVFYLLTNIRCSIAFAIWLYAYYNWRNKNRIICYILIGVTGLIHVVGILVFILTLLYEFLNTRKSKKAYFVTFFVVFIIGYIYNNLEMVNVFLDKVNIVVNVYFTQKIAGYARRTIDFQMGREFAFRICCSLLYFALLVHLHNKNKREYEIIGFFILIMYAGINLSIYFERIPYLLGLASLPILNESSLTMKKSNRMWINMLEFIILFAQIIWSIYEIMLWVNFKNGVYFGNSIKFLN